MKNKWIYILLSIILLVILYETFISKRIYDVTFIDGDTIIATFEVERNSTVPSPDIIPTKDGYKFRCWAFNGLEYDENYKVTSDMIINAIWEEDNNKSKK